MIRIGIVGTGNTVSIAERHLKGILEDGRGAVSCVYNRNMDTAEAWVRRHGLDAVAAHSYEELLDKVDAVIICTPNSSHASLAIKAMEREKHVLLEKPLGVTLKECREIQEAADRYPGIKMVGFTNRFSPVVKKAKEYFTEMGEIFSLTAYTGGKRLADPKIGVEWRMKRELSGSGALCDFGSHLLDLSLFLTGRKYEAVTAMMDTVIKERKGERVENDDMASIICSAPGTLGTFTVSRVGMDSLRLIASGEGGMVEFSLRDKGYVTFWEKNRTGGYTQRQETWYGNGDDPFIGEIGTFIDGIQNKDVGYPTIEDALYVSKVLAAAEKAAEEKREVLVETQEII